RETLATYSSYAKGHCRKWLGGSGHAHAGFEEERSGGTAMRLVASFFIPCLFVSLVVSSSRDAKAQQEAKPKREGAIIGRVIADGRPAAGAQVVVHPAVGKLFDEQTGACDEDGAFKVTGLSPGAYSLSTRMPGYVALSDSSGDSSGPRMHRIGENVAI